MLDKPKLIWEPGALDDLSRLREFLQPKNPKAAVNAARSIIKSASLLLEHPYLGHLIEDLPEFNKIFVPFGQNGYEIHYRIDNENIIILRIWHTLFSSSRKVKNADVSKR